MLLSHVLKYQFSLSNVKAISTVSKYFQLIAYSVHPSWPSYQAMGMRIVLAQELWARMICITSGTDCLMADTEISSDCWSRIFFLSGIIPNHGWFLLGSKIRKIHNRILTHLNRHVAEIENKLSHFEPMRSLSCLTWVVTTWPMLKWVKDEFLKIFKNCL